MVPDETIETALADGALSDLKKIIAAKRIEEVNASREEIELIEERIHEISANADEQLRTLQTLAKANTPKKSAASKGRSSAGGATTPQVKEAVRNLKVQKGWSNKEIAQTLKITENEVALILELADTDYDEE